MPDKKINRSILAQSRALTRLFVGLVESGTHDLFERLGNWESQLSQLPTDSLADEGHPDEQALDLVRYAILGVIFDTYDRLEQGSASFDRASRLFGKLTQRVVSPFFNNRFANAAQEKFGYFVRRGDTEVNRLIELGRSEYIQSRALADKATEATIEGWIDYLTQNPEVRELVETQSAGLANEVVEEVRERTVSADTFIESIARNMLRRIPRSSVPEPPAEIRARAVTTHTKTYRSKK